MMLQKYAFEAKNISILKGMIFSRMYLITESGELTEAPNLSFV